LKKFETLEDFYQVYSDHRTYVKAEVRKKHIRRFDSQIWLPAQMTAQHSVLELGCGAGLFLAYLEAKGVSKFIGIDSDPKGREYMPDPIADKVILGDIWAEIEKLNAKSERFDRIVMIDVFEHFSFVEGQQLLVALKGVLTADGKIVIRVPNAASPFAMQYQYGDVTHKAAYAPGAMELVALAADYRVEKFLPVKRGHIAKQLVETVIFGILNKILTDPPPLWQANMIAILSHKTA
jgi:cyclopropane fatty-acyl-phospholipid synthase-like methyltransferase